MSDLVLKARPEPKVRQAAEKEAAQDERAGLDDQLFHEASKRAGDRILAFTQQLADKLGADPSKGREEG